MTDGLLMLLYTSTAASIQQAVELLRALDDRATWAKLWAALNIRRIRNGWGDVTLLTLAAESPPDLVPDRRPCLNARVFRTVGCHAGLQRFRRLRIQELHHADLLQRLPQLPNLRNVTFDNCHQLDNLRGIACMPSLRVLTLRGCRMLTTLDGIEALPQLQALRIRGAYRLKEVSMLGTLPRLSQLSLTEVGTSQAPLRAHLPALRDLSIQEMLHVNVTGLLDGAPLTRFSGRSALRSASAMDALLRKPTLRSLSLQRTRTPRPEALRACTRLRHLRLAQSVLSDVSVLSEMPGLRTLDLRKCAPLDAFPDLTALHRLQRLTLPERLQNEAIAELALPQGLRQLNAETGRMLSLRGIERLKHLESLAITAPPRWVPTALPPTLSRLSLGRRWLTGDDIHSALRASGEPALDLWLWAGSERPGREALSAAETGRVRYGGPRISRAPRLRWLELAAFKSTPAWLKSLPALETLRLIGASIRLTPKLRDLERLSSLLLVQEQVLYRSPSTAGLLPPNITSLRIEGLQHPLQLDAVLGQGSSLQTLSVSAPQDVLQWMKMKKTTVPALHVETTAYRLRDSSLGLQATSMTLTASVLGIKLEWLARTPRLRHLTILGRPHGLELPREHMLQTLDLTAAEVAPHNRRVWSRAELLQTRRIA